MMKKDGYVVNLTGRDISEKNFYFKGLSEASRFFEKLVDTAFDMTDSDEDNNGNSRERCKEERLMDLGFCFNVELHETVGNESHLSRASLVKVNQLVAMAV